MFRTVGNRGGKTDKPPFMALHVLHGDPQLSLDFESKPIVIEAATDLTNPVWIPVLTNVLTAGSQDFVDPEWTNSPSRLYRIRSP
jgi:hypothetical protein